MKKFWNFIRDDTGERILRLEGPIDEDNFWGDEVTPETFRSELEAEQGDVTVWINSPGGNVFAAAQIYNMLREYKGTITVKVDAIAASAASVIAMAGDRVLISPVGMFMIHDPMTIAFGNKKDMEKAIDTLTEVKESIINAYAKKTGLRRGKISELMENETWMNAKKAVELGFADEILFDKKDEPEADAPDEEKDDEKEIEAVWQPYSTRIMGQKVLNRIIGSAEHTAIADEKSDNAGSDKADVESEETGVSDVSDKDDPLKPKEVPDEESKEKEGETKEKGDESEGESKEEESEEDEPDEDDPKEGDGDEDEPEEPEKKPKNESVTPDVDDKESPLIGPDGKTKDGAMPYELLRKQLEFLK